MIRLTIEINNNGHGRMIRSVHNQDGIECWRYSCFRLRSSRDIWSSSSFSTRIILTWTTTNTIFLKRNEHKSHFYYFYLTRAFELSFSKLITAIEVTVSVAITCVDTSTQHWTVLLKAFVPVFIDFFCLNDILHQKMWFVTDILILYHIDSYYITFGLKTNLTLTNRILTFIASFETKQFARTI